MTRVNLVNPIELTDQHLIAEYRELRLLTANMRRIHKKPVPLSRIPKTFTLNAGHVLFFSNKGLYIAKRYGALIDEMKRRGFDPQFPTIDVDVWPDGFYNDWTPSATDLATIRERINLRISQRPNWYRYYGTPLSESHL